MQMVPHGIKKINYVIYCPFDLAYSKKHLTSIYGPIIESAALYLYEWFIDEFEMQAHLKGISSPIERIFKHFNINFHQFCEIREKLEALNLVSTYLEEEFDKKTFHIEIKRPLSWLEFNADEKLRHLLISKIGMSEYERISLVFTGKRMPEKALNISATFNIVYNTEQLDAITSFNFEQLHSLLSHSLQAPIVINENSKLIIETYFKAYNLSINEIKYCVDQAICKLPNQNDFSIDNNRLIEQFKALIHSTPNIQLFEHIKINRDINLFNNTISASKKQLIFADYQNVNAEQYLASIQKSWLTSEQKKGIQQLRNISHLVDPIINMLTDFMLFKTKGKYNLNYLKKLADTINCLNLIDLNDVLTHLVNAYNNVWKNKFTYKLFKKQNDKRTNEVIEPNEPLLDPAIEPNDETNEINLNEAFNFENVLWNK